MTRPRIFCFHRLPDATSRRLEDRFEVVWGGEPATPVADLLEIGTRFDALVPTVTDPVPAAVFAVPGRRFGIVANYGVGYDLIDVAAARRAGVAVTNTPGVLTDCTADLTLALILMTMRRLTEGERLLRQGEWTGWRPTHHLGRRVTGAVLGIVGMGRIGQAVAARAKHGFAMQVRYTSRTRLAPEAEAALGLEWGSVDDLMAGSDIVSLHCPATAETTGLIDARRLALMRPGAVLINTARGSLVDEAALEVALRTGRIGGAGLDVFRGEPTIPRGFLDLPNVTMLPHLGSATEETRNAMGMAMAANLDAYFAGRPLPSPVG
ncbi:MAG: D-glycerate dehydrogenase [Gemmatimonadales bacterium]